jgi:ribosomal protein S12 methylthiotransferase accessory factor
VNVPETMFGELGFGPLELEALCNRYGITRFAELSGLDELQVPIWCCIRPRSRTLATSFGKGLSDNTAQISALMEALEGACAENRDKIVSVKSSIAHLRHQGLATIPLETLEGCNYSEVSETVPLEWVRGTSLFSDQTILAPFELVGMDYERESGLISPGFHMSSSGLGASRTWEAAVRHAILELVEHEVTAMFEQSLVMSHFFEAKTYQPGSDDCLDEAMALFPPELVRPVFYEIPNSFGLSVATCELLEFPTVHSFGGASSVGLACRFSAREAALAALLEAAQVRMSHIAGSREDIDWRHYKPRTEKSQARQKELANKNLAALKFAKTQQNTFNSLTCLVEGLRQAGTRDIWVFTLNQPDDPFFAVRAIADGLQKDSTHVMNLGSNSIEGLFAFLRPFE